jgi:predicted permease
MKPAPRVQALRESLTGDVAPTLWLLAGVAGLVLLVAWANVAGLALVRADAGRHDVALREALGASPLRAAAQSLAEACLLGTAAAVLAVLAASSAVWALKQFGPSDLPRLAELSIGPSGIGFILLVAVVGSALGQLTLARRDRPDELARRLRDGTGGQAPGATRQRARTLVGVLQIAAALVVLAGSALLLRTAHRLADVHPGFDAGPVTTFGILLPFARYPDAARVAFHARLLDRVRALPSVRAAGLSAQLPLAPGGLPTQGFRVDGDARSQMLAVNVASDGYFATMGIPLRAGRDFQPLDAQRPDELLVSQRAALQLFGDRGGSEALGRRLTLDPGGPTYTVVGVVGDVRHDDLGMPVAAMVYRPQVVATAPAVHPGPLPGMVLVVRSDGASEPLAAAVRDIVRDLDTGVPLFEVRGMREVVARSMARLQLLLTVTTVAAVVTLVLGMIGLHGVMAYRVALRRREFGLRMALGASAPRIARTVVARGLVLAAIGGLLGMAVFAAAAASLRAAVPGIQPWDPLALVAALLLLAATSVLACWVPARRAAAVDPAQALRGD